MRDVLYTALREAAKASKIDPEMLNEITSAEQGLTTLTEIVGYNELYLLKIEWYNKPLKERVKLFNRLV